jgi:Neuraminidase (sialidase)
MRIFAFLLFFQSFVACRQDSEKNLSATGTVFSSVEAPRQVPGKARPTAANIVFKSTDGGQTWQDISAGLPEGLQSPSIFAREGEIFLSSESGLYRSSGASETPAWEKEVFPNKNVAEVFASRTGLYTYSPQGGFFQNRWGSGIWIPVYTAMKNKGIRTILETPDGTVLVGCDSGIFKSADAGNTWKQVFKGGMILNIVEAGGVLIGGGLEGVLRSTDGGEHWSSVLNEHILAKKTRVLEGGRFATILGTEDPSKVSPEGITHRLRVSADGGKTWQRMEQTLLPLQGVYDMDARLSQVRDLYDIVQAGEYLFCSFDTGIFRSSDQGKTWEPVLPTKGKGAFNLSVSGKVVYAALGSAGC